jgi:transcriptional regulator with XRE-family HTH domain
MKLDLKEKAIRYRKDGLSYSEILEKIDVSKSTLSSWLRNVLITNFQINRLRVKNAKARSLGSVALKNKRVSKTTKIINQSSKEIKIVDNYNLKLIGTTLYWAEGSKQSEYEPSRELIFTNSDPEMIKVYLLWLKKCLNVTRNYIKFEIYIHETYKKSPKELSDYWSKVTKFPQDFLTKIYYKKNKINSFRKNKGSKYNGVLRITVRKSTDLNRKVIGWVKGISNKVT